MYFSSTIYLIIIDRRLIMPELKNINIGLMGLGTVGGGVYKLI